MRNKRLKPEKIVERHVRIWAAQKGWMLNVFDSKKQRNSKGIFAKSNAAEVGTPDLIGCDTEGHAVYIELKAPGKEGVLRLKQRMFLDLAIEHNCFACVTSDTKELEQIYAGWLICRDISEKDAREFLRDNLPKKVKVGTLIKGVA